MLKTLVFQSSGAKLESLEDRLGGPMSIGFPKTAHDAALEAAVLYTRRSIQALSTAAAALNVPVSPQMARGVQARENAWRDMDREFGLLSGAEIAAALGSRAKSGTGFATDRRNARQLLGIRRRNAYVYPGFQVDRVNGTVLAAIPLLLALIDRLGKTDEGLAQWLCAPTGQLDGERPVDHLEEPALVIGAAERHFDVQW
jgi:hypothetical protein